MKQPNMQGAKRFLRPITWGVLTGAAACILLLLISAFIMGIRDIPQAAVSIIATFSFILGGFVAGYVSAALSREKGMILGLCCGGCLFLVLFIASFTIDGSGFGLAALTKLISVLLAAAIGGILGVNKRKKMKL